MKGKATTSHTEAVEYGKFVKGQRSHSPADIQLEKYKKTGSLFPSQADGNVRSWLLCLLSDLKLLEDVFSSECIYCRNQLCRFYSHFMFFICGIFFPVCLCRQIFILFTFQDQWFLLYLAWQMNSVESASLYLLVQLFQWRRLNSLWFIQAGDERDGAMFKINIYKQSLIPRNKVTPHLTYLVLG